MVPLDIQPIGQELAIKWEDGSESFVPLEKLRRHCPCAGCRGEVDVMGNLYKNPARPLRPESFRLVRLVRVGTYAVQPVGLMATLQGFSPSITSNESPMPLTNRNLHG